MELPMAIVIGVLFAGGTYMILRPSLIRIVMGFGLYSNAANLLMITCGGYSRARRAPFVSEDAANTVLASALMDPLPPDIILTAIVISFAVGALFLTVCYRVYLDYRIDNPDELPQDDLADDPSDVNFGGVPDVIAELAEPNPNAPHEHTVRAQAARPG